MFGYSTLGDDVGYGLGVDLGVTFAAAAVRRPGGVEMVSLGDRSVAVPAMVLVRADGGLLCGDAAERRSGEDPGRVARQVKRRLGDPTPLVLAGRPYQPAGLLAAMLADIVATVSRQESGPPDEVVLTCPAAWGPYRREQFAEVPRLAGVSRVRMVTEPAAAAAHYAASRELADGETVLVYDLGGGTFDTTVLRAGPDGVRILGTPEGIEQLGGVDFDQAVFEHVDDLLGGEVSRLDPADPRAAAALSRLRRDCVLAKEALSVEPDTVIPVFLPTGHREVWLTRAGFEDMIRPLLRSTLEAVHRTLRSARISAPDLSAVLLVGGSSKIPLVAATVATEFGCPIRTDTHPKHAVALGAAILTGLPAPAVATAPPSPGPAGAGPAGRLAAAATGLAGLARRTAARRRRTVATALAALAATAAATVLIAKVAPPTEAAPGADGGAPPASAPGYQKVGYLPGWEVYQGHTPKSVDVSGQAAKLTAIDYAFADIGADGRCVEANSGASDAQADYQRPFDAASSVDGVADAAGQPLKGNFNQLRKLKAKYPNLKVLLSLGGWDYSARFSDAALTPASRAALVSSCIDLYLRGNLPRLAGDPAGGAGSAAGVFDGFDVDWQWPGGPGAPGSKSRPEDKRNLALLLAEFRRQLDAYGSAGRQHHLLSAYLPGAPDQIAGLDLPAIFASLDWASVQGYDFHGSWELTTNHQANLYPAAGDPARRKLSADLAVTTYLAHGAPARKLLLGVPFYGRGWTGVPATGDGLFQPGRPVPGTADTGTEDYVTLQERPGTRRRDPQAGAMWLYDGTTWWSYDDPQVIGEKAGYVRSKGLGGLMAWNLYGDDGTLTAAIDSGLR